MQKKMLMSMGCLIVAICLCAGGAIRVGIAGEGEQLTPENKQQQDRGKQPWVVDIEEITLDNSNYRIANWTGDTLQMTLMSLKPGEEINLEKHTGIDQFIRIEQGTARVMMGLSAENLDFDHEVTDDWAILIPGDYWHRIINIGEDDLKLYSLYGPAEHPAGTLHETHQDSMADDHHHHEEMD